MSSQLSKPVYLQEPEKLEVADAQEGGLDDHSSTG